MAKNKRDPFSYVQDTTEKTKMPKPTKKSPVKPKKSKPKPEPTPQRFIFVKYDTNDGRIVATHEMHRQAEELPDNPWTSVAKDRASAKVALTGELFNKQLGDIHNDYKVVITNKKLKLVPKN
jgi:hypothetical protein